MPISDLVYQNNEVQWRVEILGVDVSDKIAVKNVGSIRQTLDTGFLTEFQTGDCQVTLQDPEGIFSTAKDSNFFTERNWSNTGYLARFDLFGGFKPPNGELEEDLIFKGAIINIEQNAKTRDVEVTASENAEISREDVDNFGIPKAYVLPEGDQNSIHGVYNFARQISPVADNSATPTLKGTGAGDTAVERFMSQKNVLDTYGDLSELNFAIESGSNGSNLLTEEAVTSLSEPSIEALFKSPRRSIPVSTAVRLIANYYNIQVQEINVPEPDSGAYHFSGLGRPQYKISYGTQTGREFTWFGEVTDFLVNSETRLIYMLLSDRDDSVLPRLIELDTLNDSVRTLTTATSHEEWWKLATTDFDEFWILKSTSAFEGDLPRLGTYNPSEWNAVSPAQTSIVKYTRSVGTTEQKVNVGNVARPQVAMYYHYGFTPGDRTTAKNDDRFGFLPDSRHNFMFSRGVLWYRYASRTEFGLARFKDSTNTATRDIQIPRDGRNNEASFDFIIDEADNKIYGSHTSRTADRSRLLVYEKALNASY